MSSNNRKSLGKIAINAKIHDMLINDDEFYRDVTSIKRLSLPNFPKYDQWCDEDYFNIEFALAGYASNDIEIYSKLNENTVYICGNKNKLESSKGIIVRGIAKRNFKIGFIINRLYNAKKSKIFLKNGILKIQVPKLNEDVSEKIILEVQDGQN